MKYNLIKIKKTNNRLIKLLMVTISLIVLTAFPIMAQPRVDLYIAALMTIMGIRFLNKQIIQL